MEQPGCKRDHFPILYRYISIPRIAGARRSQLRIFFLLFVFKHIAVFPGESLDPRMLVLNREGRFHTESAPMESCRPAIIVSFGVTARCGLKRSQRSRNRFRGRVSWFDAAWSSTIRNTSLGPCTTGIPACVLQGLGDGDFHFSDTPVTAEVCPDIPLTFWLYLAFSRTTPLCTVRRWGRCTPSGC